MVVGRVPKTRRRTQIQPSRPGVRFVRRLSRDHLSERGAALVEAMIILPVLILICFGLIEFGLIYKDTLKIASAARAGARTGAAAIKTDGSDGETQDADYQILQAVQAALGPLASTTGPGNHADTQIVVYKASGADGTPVTAGCDVVTGTAGVCNAYTGADFAADSASFAPNGAFDCSTTTYPATCVRSQNWPAGSRKILFSDASGPEWLGVWVKTRHDYTTGVFGQNRSLSDQTVLRLEPPGVNPSLYSTTPSSFATTTTTTPGTVSGRVWNDANQDGTYQNTEPVMQVGWKLTDTGTNTVVASGNSSAATGLYSTATTPGHTYTIAFTAPVNDTFTTYGPGATNSNVTQATGVSLAFPGTGATVNAGLIVPNTANGPGSGSISGVVWKDVDNDGILQGAEARYGGLTVQLFLPNGLSPLLTTTTTAGGNYSFINLGPGTYVIRVIKGGADLFATQESGGSTPANDSDVNSSGYTGNIVVASAAVADQDAGIYQQPCLQNCGSGGTSTTTILTSISGTVWNDSNYDGTRQGTEPFVTGESVQLINPINGSVISTTTTNASGHYVFNGLVGGLQYKIRVLRGAGQANFSPEHALGGDTTTDSDVDGNGYTVPITAVSGSDIGNNDAGVIFPTISGIVWNDANKDGIRQGTELKLANVTVNLLNQSNGSTVATATTNGSGFYQFTNVAPGNYQVQFVPLATYTFTAEAQGSDTTVDSDADPTTGKTVTMTTIVGSSFTNVDAGLIAPVAQTTTTIPPS